VSSEVETPRQATAGLLALAIAIGTVAGHAFRVARLNPIHALRYE
jgi:putative ABC transport system permease protein